MIKKFKLILLFIFFISSISYANTLDEMLSQMIIIGFRGDNINSSGFKTTYKKIKNNEISGVILFQKNIKSKKDLIEMNNKFLSANKITPIISIDNEGGKIQRHNFLNSKSAKEVSKLDEIQAQNEYKQMSDLLSELKINFNFAPVVDLELNKNSIISKKQRSYSAKPQIVTKYSKIFIIEHNKNNILTSIKHFPGHGSATGDTHKGFVDATKTFKQEELIPYEKLANFSELNTIMVSHIFNSNFDEKYPASLSYKTIKGKLIDEMGYQGVVVSDDYDMGAIRKNYNLEQIVTNSINSGVNLMIFSNNINHFDKNIDKKIRKIAKKQLELGNIKIEDIENSYNKILKLKSNLKPQLN